MNQTPATTRRLTRRFVIGAAAVGITLGAAGLASAAQAVLSSDDHPTPSAVSVSASTNGADDNATTTTTSSVEVTIDSSTNVDDTADDTATTSSIDDHGQDDDSSSSSTSRSLPEPFTQTYIAAGGSITVSWTGTAFTLDSVDPADGSSAEITDQQWDRVRVEFKGAAEGRIEVRLNDDRGNVRVEFKGAAEGRIGVRLNDDRGTVHVRLG